MAKAVVLDMDPGVDDALALALALSSPELEVVALSTVSGNVPLERATGNGLKLLKWLGREDIPLYRGAPSPLAREAIHAFEVHGPTGLGAARLPDAQAQPVGNFDQIQQYIGDHPGAVTLIAVGPLTNLARAEAAAPGLLRKAAQIVIMGGALTEPGNIAPTCEFNFCADPHAARQVLRAGAPVVLLPLDCTHQVWLEGTTVEGWDYGPRGDFWRAALQTPLDFAKGVSGRRRVYLHDPLAVAYALAPGAFRLETKWIDIETEGVLTAGQVVQDRRLLVGGREGVPVQCATKVDRQIFMDLFVKRVLQGQP